MRGDDDFPGPINLGNPSEVTVRELAETIIRLTNSTSRIEFRPLPSDDPERRRPDISLARQRLGWQPTTKLEDGLRKVIDYFKHDACRRRDHAHEGVASRRPHCGHPESAMEPYKVRDAHSTRIAAS